LKNPPKSIPSWKLDDFPATPDSSHAFCHKKFLKSQHLVSQKMTYWPSSMFCTSCFSTWPWMTQVINNRRLKKKICSMSCNIYTNANITCIYLYHKNYIYIYLFIYILIYLFNRDELGIFHINLAFFKWFGYPLTRRRRSRTKPRTSGSFSMRFVSFAMIRRPRPAPTLWLFNSLLWKTTIFWWVNQLMDMIHDDLAIQNGDFMWSFPWLR
jgi:hypothetical protein